MFGLTDKITALVFGGLSAILLALCAVLYIEANGFFWIDGLKDKLEDCERDRNELRAGVEEAKRLNEQQVQRIVSEQDRISKDVEADLTARLERLRRELRAKAAPRNPGGSEASPDGKAPGTTPGEAGLCLAPDQLLRAAENEERHDQLIRWVEEQLGVKR